MSFTGRHAGSVAADYMLGASATVITPDGMPLIAARQGRYGVYVQDDWKPTDRLTINIELRYDR